MMRIVPEPVRAGRGELEAIARRLVEFAKSSPGCWVQTDELPANYAARITTGTAREFQPDSEWRVSQKGGLLHVRYVGPNGCYL